MNPSLAQALDILADSAALRPARAGALSRLCTELHRLAGRDLERREAAQVISMRLCTAKPGVLPDRTERQAQAYLARALRRQVLDQRRRARPGSLVSLEDDMASAEVIEIEVAEDHRLSHLRRALERMKSRLLPRLPPRRADHQVHLMRGLEVRVSQLLAIFEGRPPPRLAEADERASRRAAEAVRAVYSPEDPDPVDACIGRLAALDLRLIG